MFFTSTLANVKVIPDGCPTSESEIPQNLRLIYDEIKKGLFDDYSNLISADKAASVNREAEYARLEKIPIENFVTIEDRTSRAIMPEAGVSETSENAGTQIYFSDTKTIFREKLTEFSKQDLFEQAVSFYKLNFAAGMGPPFEIISLDDLDDYEILSNLNIDSYSDSVYFINRNIVKVKNKSTDQIKYLIEITHGKIILFQKILDKDGHEFIDPQESIKATLDKWESEDS